MDLFNLVFYAVICGLLSLAAPRLGRFPLRLGAGMLVGVAAAAALPAIKAALGF
ncbi:MAG: hypothetical protein KDI68_09800 [Gammaproteobacteria bacterium]|nr:hypothetical protein [Gammaproteobacteria bacterium]